MMKVWIVLRNEKIDEVFDDEEAARFHARQLNKKWAITEVIEKEVRVYNGV